MKYDIVIGLEGREFRFKDVEAVNEEEAELRCIKELKKQAKAHIHPTKPRSKGAKAECNADSICER